MPYEEIKDSYSKAKEGKSQIYRFNNRGASRAIGQTNNLYFLGVLILKNDGASVTYVRRLGIGKSVRAEDDGHRRLRLDAATHLCHCLGASS